MSDINLQWLLENFTDPVIFDIGCADIGGDSAMFRMYFPQGKIYAFECSQYWKEHNEKLASQLGIKYFHLAMADHSNGVTFHPSVKNHEDTTWPWSGSIYQPGDYLDSIGLKFDEGYTVPSTTLNEFCTKYEVYPDFIHIDAQGAEYSIFKDTIIRPKAIWAEISEFHLYDTKVTYDEFNDMMLSHGYIQKYLDNHDSLYVHNDVNFTDYVSTK